MRLIILAITTLALSTTACISVHNKDEDPDHKSWGQKLTSLRSEGPRKRILLLPFLNDSQEKDPAVARTGRDALVSGLRLTDNFIILDNTDIPKDLKQYMKDGAYDTDEISKVAAELGVVAVIEGKILEVKARKTGDEVGLIRSVSAVVTSTVAVKVYSAANNREILNEVRSATSESKTHRVADSTHYNYAADPELIRDSLSSAFQGMILPITKAVDKISWGGRVALVSGDRIYLNAGRITGINIGDILRVTDEGEDIYDPNNGVLIGKAPGRMKGTLEVVSYFGKDGCITVVHSGSGFKENDKVELY
jgi:hypothetical protein